MALLNIQLDFYSLDRLFQNLNLETLVVSKSKIMAWPFKPQWRLATNSSSFHQDITTYAQDAIIKEMITEEIKTDSAQRSSNKCKKCLPKNYS